MTARRRLLVIGNGMVGHRLIERLIVGRAAQQWEITALSDEPRPAYDRTNLSQLFAGKSADDFALASPTMYDGGGVEVRLNELAVQIDPRARVVRTSRGAELPYDKVVLASGSRAFLPPIEGNDGPNCFVYRTLDDLEAIRARCQRASVGVVVGGGLLGLEAANALRSLGLEAHVVELAPRLMPMQIDELAGGVLRARIEALGVRVHTGKTTMSIVSAAGWPSRMRFADGQELSTDIIVFTAGIRPRDELARAAGLEVGAGGGVVIDDRCLTSDPDVYAVGECALHRGRSYGLAGPGYRMADTAASHLLGGDERFTGADVSTKLNLLGIDVASFGDAFARTSGAQVLSLMDATTHVYKKLVVSADGKHLLGGILIGDASMYPQLLAMVQDRLPLPERPQDLLLPRPERPARTGIAALPETAIARASRAVTKVSMRSAIVPEKLPSPTEPLS